MRKSEALLAVLCGLVLAVGCDDGMDDADAGRDSAVMLVDGGDTDSGMMGDDAGTDGGMMMDAGTDAGFDAGFDAGGATCIPSAVRFLPPGGSLTVGQLCDDVFACARDSAHAAAIMAASPRFVCGAGGGFGCTSGIQCRYQDPVGRGPSTLDMSEIDEICKGKEKELLEV